MNLKRIIKTKRIAVMRIFEVTSEKYNGVVVYKFGDDDRFAGVDYSGSEC